MALAQETKPSLRLMPLGASITMGYLSTDGNGYRKDLYDLLTSDGFTVEMVGSRHDGTMQNNANEGWPGFRISQVQSKAELSVPKLLPNIITLNAGTNDCAQNFDIEHTGQRMDSLLEYLWIASPHSTIILSTLTLNLNPQVEARVQQVNQQFRNLAEQKQAENKRIILVDMHSPAGPQREDMADDTHPDDAGYAKMAKIWFQGIQEASAKGFLQKPQALPPQ